VTRAEFIFWACERSDVPFSRYVRVHTPTIFQSFVEHSERSSKWRSDQSRNCCSSQKPTSNHMLTERLPGQRLLQKREEIRHTSSVFRPATADRRRFKKTEIAHVIYRDTEWRRPKARSNERRPERTGRL
jgi:hypothetical protein